MIIEDRMFIIKNKILINKVKYIFGNINELHLTTKQLMIYFPRSKYKIKIKCDKCGKEFEIPCKLRNYNELQLCSICKIKDTTFKHFGVENASQSNEIKKKKEKTCEKHFGCKYPSQSNIVKDKIEKNNLKNFGFKNPSQSNEIKKKKEITCEKHFGVKSPAQSDIVKNKMLETLSKHYGESIINPGQSLKIREKVKQTCLNKYNCINVFQNKEIKQKINQSLYKNNTGPCSKQQKHVFDLLNNSNYKLNYPCVYYLLDIADIQNKIYIEYDGGGHNLSVKLGECTQKEFDNKEIKREKFIKSFDWKMMRIKCNNDKLPNDNILLSLINECINYLKYTNYTWVYIDLNQRKIISHAFNKNF